MICAILWIWILNMYFLDLFLCETNFIEEYWWCESWLQLNSGVYRKKSTTELMAAIQLGIGQSITNLASRPKRDLLLQDFSIVETVYFPRLYFDFFRAQVKMLNLVFYFHKYFSKNLSLKQDLTVLFGYIFLMKRASCLLTRLFVHKFLMVDKIILRDMSN